MKFLKPNLLVCSLYISLIVAVITLSLTLTRVSCMWFRRPKNITPVENIDYPQLHTMEEPGSKVILVTHHQLFEQVNHKRDRTKIEDPLLTSRRPKWWDYCHKKFSFNQTIISLQPGPRVYHPKHVIEDIRRDKANFLRNTIHLRPQPSASGELTRRKRSVITSMPTDQNDSTVKANIIFDGDTDKLIGEAFADDIRVSWYALCAIERVKHLKLLLHDVNETISSEMEQVRPDYGLVKNILDQRYTWLPTLNSVSKTVDTCFSDAAIIANYSHYVQIFSVSLEQMIYDQATVGEKLFDEFSDIEDFLESILCDIVTLKKHVINLSASKVKLYKFLVAANMSISDPRLSRLHLVDSVPEGRKNCTSNIIESSWYSSFAEVEESDTAGEESEEEEIFWKAYYAGRDLMPISQRKLNNIERLIRDQSIVNDLEKFLLFYESKLIDIYVTDGRRYTTLNQQLLIGKLIAFPVPILIFFGAMLITILTFISCYLCVRSRESSQSQVGN